MDTIARLHAIDIDLLPPPPAEWILLNDTPLTREEVFKTLNEFRGKKRCKNWDKEFDILLAEINRAWLSYTQADLESDEAYSVDFSSGLTSHAWLANNWATRNDLRGLFHNYGCHCYVCGRNNKSGNGMISISDYQICCRKCDPY